MASLGLQILGVGLAVLGWIGNILICMLPLWKVSAFIGNNIVVAQTIWEGLWMSCVVQSTGQMQCKVYDSLLALPPDLQAARAMIVIAILFSLFGLLLSVVGGKCTTCVGDKTVKARVAISAGFFFTLSGALCLITVSLPANTIIKDFYNPMVPDAQRRELVHPQTFHDHQGSDNISPHKSSDSPHGQSAGEDGAQPTNQGQ
uniref:Claudin n=1 Tax=Amphilophus citrinellus TaxID=61819 RepID=A0A3Q0SVL1_AMPCI